MAGIGESKPSWKIKVYYQSVGYDLIFPHRPSANSAAAKLRYMSVLGAKQAVRAKFGRSMQPIGLSEPLDHGNTIYLVNA